MAQKKNYHTIRYGQRDGEIKFGHITDENEQTAVMLRSGWAEGLHYFQMYHTGKKGVLRNSTICKSPGPFKVSAGAECKVTPNNIANQAGIELDAESGDIIIKAPYGKIKIQAQDIELIAQGATGTNGLIKLESNDKVEINSKSITMNAKESYKIFSEKTLDLVGNAIMNIYGGLMDFADGATKLRGSKCGPSSTEENAKRLKDENASAMREQFAAEAEQEAWKKEQDATTGGT